MYKQIAREISRNGFYDKDIKLSSRFFEKEVFLFVFMFCLLLLLWFQTSGLRFDM